MEYLERSRRSRLYRRPSISADILRSVLKQHREASSSSSSDEETISIQAATSTGPDSMSIPSHSNEVEDIFPIYSPINESNTVPAQLHKTMGNLSHCQQHPRLPSVSSCQTLKQRSPCIKEQRSVSVDQDDVQELVTLRHKPTIELTTAPNGRRAFVSKNESFSRANRFAFKKKRASTLGLNVQQVCYKHNNVIT